MNVVLIGARGSGKTSLGKILSERLMRPFRDCDELLAERAHRSIAEIFASEGEVGFRRRERAVIAELASHDGLVLATGGGAVLDPDNVSDLKRNGRLIWLRAGPEELHRRITADTASAVNRPRLTGLGGLEEVRAVLAVRTPIYAAAADVVLDVEGRGLGELADQAIRTLGLSG